MLRLPCANGILLVPLECRLTVCVCALQNPYPPQPRSDRPEMTAYHPVPQQHYQPQDQSYRLPPPANFAPQTHMQSYPQQPASAASAAMNQQAPRQRTAIACKYCRRRKVCSALAATQSLGATDS